MEDKEKVIKHFEHLLNAAKGNYQDFVDLTVDVGEEILALLKDQENREKRICKAICDLIRGSCSTDTEDDKDFVCYEIQKCFVEGR